MTGKTGAPITYVKDWDAIDWQAVQAEVFRLQMRIAKAYREKKYGKAKSLQWLLTHSLSAKLLAVKRVTSNKGAKTPGVDKVRWNTSKQKLQATYSLKRRGYKSPPLRRILIPKKQTGKYRPLSIPTIQTRAMQALYLLGLEPISEVISNQNAYGFRPKRNAADAITRCFYILNQEGSAQYILEADIKSCFDKISHRWALENVPMDKVILRSWLEAGYIHEGEAFSTTEGTPQGGIISPCILNIVLSGLEDAVLSALPCKSSNRDHKIYFSIYADDFIITGASREILENKVKPVVENFLSKRGLSLSEEKTHITHISDGFDFLGTNIRKYNGQLITKPSKGGVKTFLNDIRETIKANKTAKAENLIRLLNPKISGWTNYHKYSCAKRTFGYIDSKIFEAIWKWAKRRHADKSRSWIKRKYFRSNGSNNWIFSEHVKHQSGGKYHLDLMLANSVKIQRHTKIIAEATPYDPNFIEYFKQRSTWRKLYQPSLDKLGTMP